MKKDHKTIAGIWRKEYSSQISSYSKFEMSEHFKRIAALFAPGESYFYILNMHNLELDYVSTDVTKFSGLEPADVNMGILLKAALPKEFEILERKEMVIRDFMIRYLEPSQRMNYKIAYTYEMKDHKGKKRIMLMQANVISLAKNKTPLHILVIHSDISHLVKSSTSKVSFINLKESESYYNIPTDKGVFLKKLGKSEPDITEFLTPRETEIVELLAKGLQTKQIAEELLLSVHTVRTHRKNILSKTGCRNTAELIAESMVAGIVQC